MHNLTESIRAAVRRSPYSGLGAISTMRVTSQLLAEYLSTCDRVRADTRRELAKKLTGGVAVALADYIGSHAPPRSGHFAANFMVCAQHGHHVAREYHFRAHMLRDPNGRTWRAVVGLVVMTAPFSGRGGRALPTAVAVAAKLEAERVAMLARYEARRVADAAAVAAQLAQAVAVQVAAKRQPVRIRAAVDMQDVSRRMTATFTHKRKSYVATSFGGTTPVLAQDGRGSVRTPSRSLMKRAVRVVRAAYARMARTGVPATYQAR